MSTNGRAIRVTDPMTDNITKAVSAAIVLGTMLWTPLGDVVNAAGGQAEILALVVAGYTVVHGIVHWAHSRVAG